MRLTYTRPSWRHTGTRDAAWHHGHGQGSAGNVREWGQGVMPETLRLPACDATFPPLIVGRGVEPESRSVCRVGGLTALAVPLPAVAVAPTCVGASRGYPGGCLPVPPSRVLTGQPTRGVGDASDGAAHLPTLRPPEGFNESTPTAASPSPGGLVCEVAGLPRPRDKRDCWAGPSDSAAHYCRRLSPSPSHSHS